MEALRIEILNPKARIILKQLADLDLISISKDIGMRNDLKKLLIKLRAKSANAPTLEEITKEVEKVRSGRYEKK